MNEKEFQSVIEELKKNDNATNKLLIDKYEYEIKLYRAEIFQHQRENAYVDEVLQTANTQQKEFLQANKAKNDIYIDSWIAKIEAITMLLKVAYAESRKENEVINENNEEDGLSQ